MPNGNNGGSENKAAGSSDSGTTGRDVVSGVAGAGLLGWVGSHMGIAARGGAVSGLLPLAVVGAAAGYGISRMLRTEDKSSALEKENAELKDRINRTR